MPEASDDPRAALDLMAADRALAQGRRAGRVPFSGLPFVAWGCAWMVVYPALEWLQLVAAFSVGVVGFALASVASWKRSGGVRSGFEARIRAGWLTVLVASPFLVATVTPLALPQLMLLLGGLWGLAMTVTGVATGDLPLAGVAGATVVCAGVATHLPAPLTSYGLAAGLLLAAFGVFRLLDARRRR